MEFLKQFEVKFGWESQETQINLQSNYFRFASSEAKDFEQFC